MVSVRRFEALYDRIMSVTGCRVSPEVVHPFTPRQAKVCDNDE
jgi:hypothetical protein